ncbi:MAG: arginine--tRNA ligase [Patescibacteria group bacterium]|nr:arginine--tRNA ligase [Patescibacteria group bacterium]
MISDILKKAVDSALVDLGVKDRHKIAYTIEHPDNLSHGDYSTNVALVCAKELKLAPRVLAEKLLVLLEKNKPEQVEKIEIAGPGFVNFSFKRNFFTSTVAEILKEREKFGSNKIGKGKKIVVEYSSPNIAKPFTVGHLRSTIIGDAVANILDFSGYKVIRDNHLGDWGTQFGKQIVALKKWGSVDEMEQSKNKMAYLVDLYVKFHDEVEKDPKLEDEGRAAFAKLEKGDRETMALYKKIVTISREYFKSIYTKLGVGAFDTEQGEYFYESYISKAKSALEQAKLLQESEGAKLVFFPDEKYPPLMIEKKDGATLYATRDLATDLWRLDNYGKDIVIINEVGVEQTLYFQQLFEVEAMLNWFKSGQRVHIAHGHYRFKDGKMSTRKGNVIWLEDIIDEAEKRAGEINIDTAHMVGVGAIKFNDLKRESRQDIVFDWDEMLNLKGDSGPYLQYSTVRAKAVLAKASEMQVKAVTKIAPSQSFELEKILYRFPEIVERAAREYEPHYLTTYLTELAGAFNSFYGNNQIVSSADEYSAYKIALTHAFAIVMENGLKLLGIEVPERM